MLSSEANTAGPTGIGEVALQTCQVWLIGYLEALRDLERRLHGACTVQPRRSKPEPRACPLCAERVGLSSEVPPLALPSRDTYCILERAVGDKAPALGRAQPKDASNAVGVRYCCVPRSHRNGA